MSLHVHVSVCVSLCIFVCRVRVFVRVLCAFMCACERLYVCLCAVCLSVLCVRVSLCACTCACLLVCGLCVESSCVYGCLRVCRCLFVYGRLLACGCLLVWMSACGCTLVWCLLVCGHLLVRECLFVCICGEESCVDMYGCGCLLGCAVRLYASVGGVCLCVDVEKIWRELERPLITRPLITRFQLPTSKHQKSTRTELEGAFAQSIGFSFNDSEDLQNSLF